ncbi:MAG: WD40 repeat domain-containing protein [Gemmataceae bacterium]
MTSRSSSFACPRRFLMLGLLLVSSFAAWLAPSRGEGPPTPARCDALGDPLPEGAFARLGSTRFRHSDKVWCLAFSPDGKTVASGGLDEVVRFWDVKTGRQLRLSSRYSGAVAGLAYSPDGATLALRDWSGDKTGIFLLDPATAKARRFVKFPRYGRGGHNGDAVAFSPDGKILASVNPGGEICLFDPASGKELAVLGKHNHDNVPVLVFSPDGRILASSGQDVTIRLWDVARRKPQFVLRSEDTTAFPIVFSRDGKWLISGGGTQKNPQQWDSPWEHPAIRVWDTATGKQLRVFKDTDVRGRVCSLALAPDGRTLAVSSQDKLRLWDVTTGKVLRTLSGSHRHNWPVSRLCFSPDGKLLAGGLDNTVGLWDVESGRLLSVDANDSASNLACVALSGAGRLLAVGDGDGYLSLWDFRTRQLIRRFHGHDTRVLRVAFSPDNKILASISAYDRLRAWDVATGRERFHYPDDSPNGSRPTELAFAPDGKLIAYSYFCGIKGSGPRGIRLLDAATGAERQNLPIGNAELGYFVGIGFSPDGRHLVGTTAHNEIYGWRREGDRFVAKGLLAQEPIGGRVAFNSQGFLSVDTFSGKASSFRDFASGRPNRDLSGFPRLGGVLAFSRDGRYLAAGPQLWRGGDPKKPRDSTLRVCEMASGQEVLRWQLPPHTGCNALAFAPDGRTLVAAMTDTTVLLWNLFPADKKAAKVVPVLWADLGDNDAAKAYRAMYRWIAAPADAIALLRRRVKPDEGVDEKRIDRWIADLGADAFAVREKATEELRKIGELAEPACRKALASRPTLEMRRRLQGLLEGMPYWRPTPEILRQLRAIEVLERIGTLEAQKLLESMSGGAAGARLTREARAAIQRLQAHQGAKP